MGKKGKCRQETCIKDTRTKSKGVGLRVGGGGGRVREAVVGKWRQLHLNISNKKI